MTNSHFLVSGWSPGFIIHFKVKHCSFLLLKSLSKGNERLVPITSHLLVITAGSNMLMKLLIPKVVRKPCMASVWYYGVAYSWTCGYGKSELFEMCKKMEHKNLTIISLISHWLYPRGHGYLSLEPIQAAYRVYRYLFTVWISYMK